MFRKDNHVFVYNQTKETFLAFKVRVGDSFTGRLVGLLGQRSLPQDSGLWIYPANSVHTIGMLFTFDLVLIDKDFKVAGLKELLPPFRITRPNFRAESAIELPAHTIFRSRTEIGDQLVIERYPARELNDLLSIARGDAGDKGELPAVAAESAVPVEPCEPVSVLRPRGGFAELPEASNGRLLRMR